MASTSEHNSSINNNIINNKNNIFYLNTMGLKAGQWGINSRACEFQHLFLNMVGSLENKSTCLKLL